MTKKICFVSRKFDEESGRCEWIYAERLKQEMQKRRNDILFRIVAYNIERLINTSLIN